MNIVRYLTTLGGGILKDEQTPSAMIRSAAVKAGYVTVVLSDGRTLSTPIEWYPVLAQASRTDLDEIEISPFGLHWEKLDEDLSLAGMLAGRRSELTKVIEMEAFLFELADHREQRRLSLLADARIDYPEQQDSIRRFVND